MDAPAQVAPTQTTPAQDAPTQTTPTQTTPAEPGLRPVTNGDVASYAKRKCKQCWGRGLVVAVRVAFETVEGVRVRNDQRTLVACDCAVRRFIGNRRADLEQVAVEGSPERKRLFWKAGREPIQSESSPGTEKEKET